MGRRTRSRLKPIQVLAERTEDLPEFTRQRAFYNPEAHDPRVVVIGAGGIGGPVVYQLSKLGVRHITVFDPDCVARHNLATTPYAKTDVGKPKVEALARIVKPFGVTISAKVRAFQGGKLPANTDILVAAVDSMPARKMLFKAAVKQNVPFFIDGRIGGESIRVYALRPNKPTDRRKYRASLVPDAWATPLPCTAQQVADVGHLIASLITRTVRQWVVRGAYIPELHHEQDSLTYPIKASEVETRHRRSRGGT